MAHTVPAPATDDIVYVTALVLVPRRLAVCVLIQTSRLVGYDTIPVVLEVPALGPYSVGGVGDEALVGIKGAIGAVDEASQVRPINWDTIRPRTTIPGRTIG